MAMSLGKLIGCVLVMWLLVVLMISGPLFHSGEPDEQVLARLTRAVSELETLKQQNEELRSLLNAIKEPSRKEEAKEPKEPKEPVIQQTGCGEPSQEYEVRRRRAADGVQELWFYARAQLKKLLPNLKQEDKATLQRIIDDLAEHRRAIQLDLEEMRRADGHDAWRQAESRALSNLVRSRLSQLQHPADCGQAPKLVCSLNKGCGYGCQVHHATYCLITAYATRRTLVLHSKGWRYSSAGWESVFLPVSNSCTEAPSGVPWSANVANAPVVELPIIDNVQPRPAFLPLAVPEDLAARITRLHGQPGLWWVSQVLGYLLRPQPSLQSFFDKAARDMGFKGPVVGVHVRRTDKVGTEADFHGIEEYMEYVADYFERLALKGGAVPRRRVYLATDDPKLLGEARSKYPNYQFYGDSRIANTAALGQRYSSESLRGVLLDIHMLSRCDYLVCTFSSQVCRLAYEILQLSHVDAADRFHSLDDIYYFGGQKPHNQIAIFNHTARSSEEIDVRVGDTLGIAGNHWDGYSKGVNRRTGRSGLYPAFKAVEKVDSVPFPVQ
uniref:Alpha-(1,6)-fucosyltransferase n=1 Tax=Rhipicephalus appendiculatus TaxID=34631 RepID=A0A131YZ78_RHIAP